MTLDIIRESIIFALALSPLVILVLATILIIGVKVADKFEATFDAHFEN